MSKHAVDRLHQRAGLSKAVAKKIIEDKPVGLPQACTTGSLRRYLDRLSIIHHSQHVIGDNDMLYAIKADGTIATVIQLPQHIRRIARQQLKDYKQGL